MRRVKRVIVVLMVLVVALVVLAFVLENQQNVCVSLLGFGTGQMPVSVFVVVALVVGMLLGPLLGILLNRRRPRLFLLGEVKE
ncbi:lipopolysaccharide assembly protein LapA domain-containing protein [Pseudomonas extremaustralis]|uniref:lipopolysaccharide assembly protein LapA domain-containing protein n=1 Tax=Pseudomonas extremaustralis TaxID=359110 RepID=UPI0023E00E8F|nr:lipopolysaccharide assembly protein LapA domain-containing protein [Pseudomonas extremaustralis]MDF3134940.1 lipopolysaccharide assembly protein LapA domain-containing protein [Pseudomonas extremaustralis]